ncbi:MAG: hypothetical protein ACI976_002885 [Aureispira sp.]|jgi:hypothetical protein
MEQLEPLRNAISNYKTLKDVFEDELKDVTYLEGKDGVLYEKASSGIVTTLFAGAALALHKNNKKSKGTFALYEIIINGEHYKFGKAAADAKSLTQTDLEYISKNGTQHTVAKGIPNRLKDQIRHGVKLYDKIEVNFEIYKDITTGKITQMETAKIEGRALKNGNVVGSGNANHAKGIYTRSSKFVKDLIKASRLRFPRIKK